MKKQNKLDKLDKLFSKIENQKFAAKFAGSENLRMLFIKAWQQPQMDALWEMTRDEEIRNKLTERVYELVKQPKKKIAMILYMYMLDLRDSNAGKVLIPAVYAKLSSAPIDILDAFYQRTMRNDSSLHIISK